MTFKRWVFGDDSEVQIRTFPKHEAMLKLLAMNTNAGRQSMASKNNSTRTKEDSQLFSRRNDVIAVFAEQISVTDFPIDEHTKFFAFSSTRQVPPGGSFVRYTSGPQGISVTITLTRISNTSGHNHAGGPTGSIAPAAFTLTGRYPQNVISTYQAPDAAGTIQQVTRGSNGQTDVNYNQVGFTGFAELTGGVGLTLTGATPAHPRNHFGIPILIGKLQQLAAAFYTKFNKSIFVNDMSLEQGGLYDINGTWAPPHSTHREGRTVDINSTSMTPEEQDFFRQTAVSLGFAVVLETVPPHWHLAI